MLIFYVPWFRNMTVFLHCLVLTFVDGDIEDSRCITLRSTESNKENFTQVKSGDVTKLQGNGGRNCSSEINHMNEKNLSRDNKERERRGRSIGRGHKDQKNHIRHKERVRRSCSRERHYKNERDHSCDIQRGRRSHSHQKSRSRKRRHKKRTNHVLRMVWCLLGSLSLRISAIRLMNQWNRLNSLNQWNLQVGIIKYYKIF